MSDVSKKSLYVSFGIVACLFFSGCVLYSFVNLVLTIDDAFISFRFARNFADGYGFVFNPGGARIEGFSNLLWVLLLSIPSFFNVSILHASIFLGVLFSLGALFVMLQIEFHFFEEKRYFWLPALLCSMNSVFLYYALSGMETSLYVFLMISGIYFLLKGARDEKNNALIVSSLLFFLMALTRPEGVLFFVGAVLYQIADIKRKKKIIFYQIILFAILFGFYLLGKYIYFGDIFPTSYYVKVSNFSFKDRLIKGLIYTYVFFSENLFILVLAVSSFFLFFKERKKLQRLVFLLVGLQLVFIVYAGGDVYQFNQWRFFLPVIVLVLLIIPDILMKIMAFFQNTKYLKYCFYGLVLIVYFFTTDTYLLRSKINKDVFVEFKRNPMLLFERARRYLLGFNNNLDANIGKWLDRNYPKETVIASDQAGQVPFYANLKFVDLVGLTTKEMALFKKDSVEYFNVLGRFQPDLLLLFPNQDYFFKKFLKDNNYRLIKMFGSSTSKSDTRYFLYKKNIVGKDSKVLINSIEVITFEHI